MSYSLSLRVATKENFDARIYQDGADTLKSEPKMQGSYEQDFDARIYEEGSDFQASASEQLDSNQSGLESNSEKKAKSVRTVIYKIPMKLCTVMLSQIIN